MKGWKLQRPAGPNGYWEILDEEGNSIATLYGGADDKEIERKATLIANAERMFEALEKIDSESEFLNTGVNAAGNNQISQLWKIANSTIEEIKNATNN